MPQLHVLDLSPQLRSFSAPPKRRAVNFIAAGRCAQGAMLNRYRRRGYPPTGNRGSTPQKKKVNASEITMLTPRATIIDRAVAAPTPTGPPRAV